MCDKITGWMVDEFQKLILTRCDEMRKIRRGSVLSGEPKILYVKAIYRPKRDAVQAIRNHFNSALENKLSRRHNHYIMNIEIPNYWFDHTNFLTAEGQLEFWRIFDKQIEEFDDHKDEDFLKPKPQIDNANRDRSREIQYRLPPPPPAGPAAKKRLPFSEPFESKPTRQTSSHTSNKQKIKAKHYK